MDENEKVDEERKKGKLGSETSEGDGKTWWQTSSLKREKKTNWPEAEIRNFIRQRRIVKIGKIWAQSYKF